MCYKILFFGLANKKVGFAHAGIAVKNLPPKNPIAFLTLKKHFPYSHLSASFYIKIKLFQQPKTLIDAYSIIFYKATNRENDFFPFYKYFYTLNVKNTLIFRIELA